MNIEVVVLAAGKGSRMKSDLPKVLHPVGNKPMLAHVLDAANHLNPKQIVTVIGHGAEQVKARFVDSGVQWALQEQQLGTGHAVQQALDFLSDSAKTLILYGDVPLITAESLMALINSEAEVAILTTKLDDPSGYGRIVRDRDAVTAIVEQKDASEAQKRINEVNTGIMALDSSLLKQLLPLLSSNNAQSEFYLTDIVKLAAERQRTIAGVIIDDHQQVAGANDRQQLAALESVYRQRQVEKLLHEGATVIDPARIDIWGTVTVGKDVVIEPNVVFIGDVKLGNKVVIEANSRIENTTIGDSSHILSHSRIESSVIEDNVSVGPYARIRPNTLLKSKAKIGNFVETKKSQIGEGSKVNHLSYIGDSELGDGVNIGAGTITCNYDGKNKFKTTIQNGSFVGSNTALVAPVNVGENAVIGAGSTITKDIPSKNLAIARQKQRNIPKS